VILDTNALSAVAADEPAVVRVYRLAASMEPPVIVLGEYRFAIGQSKRQHSKRQAVPSPQMISGSLHSAGDTGYNP
jgi:predicted nucleic acid-binding protein